MHAVTADPADSAPRDPLYRIAGESEEQLLGTDSAIPLCTN